MNRLTALLAGLLLLVPISATAQVQPGQSFSGKVVSVTDGDTFDVRRSIGGTVTVRLRGVDAPETSQPYGTAATRAARRLVGEKNVRVSVEEIGKYGRAVARIDVQGSGWAPCSFAAGSRGTTANSPQTPPNTPAFSGKLEMLAVACGHRQVPCRPGRGETDQVGAVKSQTGTARTSRRKAPHSGSTNGTDQGTLTAWTAMATAKRANPWGRDPSGFHAPFVAPLGGDFVTLDSSVMVEEKLARP